jgi:Protein of unknown function (DUF5818)
MNAKIALVILTTIFTLGAGVASAQESTDDAPKTATGCLVKTPINNGYVLTDQNGKTWSLSSTTVRLNPHVGHTVTVTGTIPKDARSTDAAPENNLAVTKLEMVRDTCKQP